MAQGVPLYHLETCGRISAATHLMSVGCYNHTTSYQRVPSQYLDEIGTFCNGSSSDCGQCRPTFFRVAWELANTSDATYVTNCILTLGMQFSSLMSSIDEVSAWLNCYYQFPPPLAILPPVSPTSADHILKWVPVGVFVGVGVVVLFLVILAVFVVKRYPLRKARFNRKLATLSRISSISLRALQKRLQIYSRKQPEKATKNFDESQLLGSGASGKVYVGELDGEVVAIKVQTINSGKNGVKVRLRRRFQILPFGNLLRISLSEGTI